MIAYSAEEYPPLWKIAVTKCGSRIHVWPDESEGDGMFTGHDLRTSCPSARAARDLSTLWLRSAVIGIDEPTDADRRLMIASPKSEGTESAC